MLRAHQTVAILVLVSAAVAVLVGALAYRRGGTATGAARHLLALVQTLLVAPWLYAPSEPRRRLLWFTGATLLAGLLAVRAYMTAG